MSILPPGLFSKTIDISAHIGYYYIVDPIELCHKIITGMTEMNSVYLYTYECRSIYTHGLIDLLDRLCALHHWNKSDIYICTGTTIDTHPEYPVSHLLIRNLTTIDPSLITPQEWNRKYKYGMFIGRASATRMYASMKHHRFAHNASGLTSFNHNIRNVLDNNDAITYLGYSGQTVDEMYDTISSYSDIDDQFLNTSTGVSYPQNIVNENVWDNVYANIPIEIICETLTDEGDFQMSEKLIRPILYKRPFLLISAPGSFAFLNNLIGIRFFEGVIPTYYDEFSHQYRVDQVFNILNDLIESGDINYIIENCKEDIDHNYNMLVEHFKFNQQWIK